ncbi:amino acid transporter [Neobacillus notoginsengisoli]|uniref:Amino acid transporter n=1 Tax=Neobacillus notoginsengisoli TaxID=1578198 RepID=A0A417YY00_9BACI|nr:LysE family transporter [Neobacillus notoginsengisoli]RHW42601.1 amino acid transporter [Neobacillus notoginsengisoli]
MTVYLSYVLLGLSLAAPIGPINAAQMDRGIRYGFWHSYLTGVGAAIADGFYMLIVYAGVVRFIEVPIVQTFLWLFGAFVLLYSGIESLISIRGLEMGTNRKKEPLYKSFVSGFFMSLSNPLTILFWLGIYGSVLAKIAATSGRGQLVLYSLAIFSGLLIWDITMAALATGAKRFLTSVLLTAISVLSGLSLIGFGLYFGWQGIIALLSW